MMKLSTVSFAVRCAILAFVMTPLVAMGLSSEGTWPPPADHPLGDILLKDLEFKDPALKDCLLDWASRDITQYSRVKDVRELSCSGKGITSLEGMEVFDDFIIALDLGENDIKDWSPIYGFHHLGSLWIFDTEMTCDQLEELRNNIQRSWIAGMNWDLCTR